MIWPEFAAGWSRIVVGAEFDEAERIRVCAAKPAAEMVMVQGKAQETVNAPDKSVRPKGWSAASEMPAPATVAPDASSTTIEIWDGAGSGIPRWAGGRGWVDAGIRSWAQRSGDGNSAGESSAPTIALNFNDCISCID